MLPSFFSSSFQMWVAPTLAPIENLHYFAPSQFVIINPWTKKELWIPLIQLSPIYTSCLEKNKRGKYISIFAISGHDEVSRPTFLLKSSGGCGVKDLSSGRSLLLSSFFMDLLTTSSYGSCYECTYQCSVPHWKINKQSK